MCQVGVGLRAKNKEMYLVEISISYVIILFVIIAGYKAV